MSCINNIQKAINVRILFYIYINVTAQWPVVDETATTIISQKLSKLKMFTYHFINLCTVAMFISFIAWHYWLKSIH